jgi:hypothetical protein
MLNCRRRAFELQTPEIHVREDRSIEPSGKSTLTRRRMISLLASVGAGVVTSPLMSGRAAAREANETSGTRMQAKAFFEPHIPTALRRALHYAGDGGFVASMPALLHARANAPYENIIWNTWFTAYSEESVVTTPQGNHVVAAVHGGGIFASPERFERSYHADLNRTNAEGLTGQTAARITTREARDVLEGRLPDGREVPVYPFAEFRQGIVGLPRRFGVVLDFEEARRSKNGYVSFEALKDDPNMIVRAGGAGPLVAYLDRFQARHDTKLMGNWHPYDRIDPAEPQTRILFLAGNRGGVGSEGNEQAEWGYDAEDGMGGDASMVGMARYVAVAPRNVSTSLQSLDFEL